MAHKTIALTTELQELFVRDRIRTCEEVLQ
jgi:hypothetical protein